MATEPCPVCDGSPRVLVAMRHPTMRRFTRDLLEHECGCWVATEVHTGEVLADTLRRMTPDLLIVDAADITRCCREVLALIPPQRVIVVGPEPDPAYRAAALATGVGSWIPRDRVADDLADAMRRALGCSHDPCPARQEWHPAQAMASAPPRTRT